MIPKIIHYCWFGGNPKSELSKKCIESWKEFFPDYKIIEWNENNFNVNIIPYTSEAYQKKKYAFVSDFARLWILYHYGGIYFDTDVQVIKHFDDIIKNGAFMGCQNISNPEDDPAKLEINPGLGIGAPKGHLFYHDMIELYKKIHFTTKDGNQNLKTIVEYTSDKLVSYGLKNIPDIQYIANIHIYPWDYFCPLSPTLVLNITENTRSIHLFDASWCSDSVRLRKKIKRILGYKIVKILQPIFNIVGLLRKNL